SLALASADLAQAVIMQTVYLLNAGYDISLLRPVLNGLLAGGSVAVVPAWLATALAFYGVMALYLAIFIACNPQPGSLRKLFSMSHWRRFAWHPRALRRREALRQRLSAARQDLQGGKRRPARGQAIS